MKKNNTLHKGRPATKTLKAKINLNKYLSEINLSCKKYLPLKIIANNTLNLFTNAMISTQF